MGTVIPFMKSSSVFEPETTEAMAKAFDELCKALRLTEAAAIERETIASKIIALAERGERDCTKLIEGVLRDVSVISACVPPTLSA